MAVAPSPSPAPFTGPLANHGCGRAIGSDGGREGGWVRAPTRLDAVADPEQLGDPRVA
jgi:hypothetical protein